jgi:hypothetical protein
MKKVESHEEKGGDHGRGMGNNTQNLNMYTRETERGEG